MIINGGISWKDDEMLTRKSSRCLNVRVTLPWIPPAKHAYTPASSIRAWNIRNAPFDDTFMWAAKW